ncbi:MAG TPA: hypothetical protein VHY79_14020 [Rhizomicrobium sp.]|jgi:hypothetical protein|nr:hypothetical protein [Rhizomicrobium sp.]
METAAGRKPASRDGSLATSCQTRRQTRTELAFNTERQFNIAMGIIMNTDSENLEADLVRLKRDAATLREKCSDLGQDEIERLLSPLRGCMVELIALRSSLEKVKADRSEPHAVR